MAQEHLYCSKTFDTAKLARQFKERALEQVVRGELQPANVRAEQRRTHSDLDQSMTHWATLYVEEITHGSSRLSDYKLVGQLLADKTLRDFGGKAGAQLVEGLAQSWRLDRQPRTKVARPADAPPPKPLSDQTIRLRLTALMRLIKFAKAKLPAGAAFEMPAMDELFEFKLPPARSTPREREPLDDEAALLLEHFGVDSDFGHFLRAIDETGCRLGEIRSAEGHQLSIFTVAGQVVGGYLTLTHHKTCGKIGIRKVPLSLFAAQILHARKLRYGDGRLFPSLGSTDKVCKEFDSACTALGLSDLLIKDYRRAFINRNKYCVAHVDMVNIVGQSSLLDAENVTPSEQNVLEAVGHVGIGTTSGYANPRLADLANVFTRTSRWTRISTWVPGAHAKSAVTAAVAAPDVAALQRTLTETLARLAQAGVTTVAPNEVLEGHL